MICGGLIDPVFLNRRNGVMQNASELLLVDDRVGCYAMAEWLYVHALGAVFNCNLSGAMSWPGDFGSEALYRVDLVVG